MNALAKEPGATRIRDLDGREFARRYACDRFTATVLANRFDYVIDHMCERLLACAFSPILRDAYDFAATLAGPPEADYPTPVVSKSLILFTGTMTDSVRNTIVEYGLERVEPGDVIVANDPYRTGTHVNDLMFIRPVFHGGRIVAFVNIKAHQLDMGGAVPGGFSATKTSTYENGLVLSPRALYKAGRPVRETWTLIFDNVRFGDLLKPDMHTICGALELGERLMLSTIERYGAAPVVGAMNYVCDADAERMTRAIEHLPDGVWQGEALIDCDGIDESEEYRILAKITKRKSRIEVDVSGTSRQARTCINATALDTKTTVGVALKFLLDPRGPFTSGTYRPIDMVIPDGTILSALPPDGVVFAYGEPTQALMAAIMSAMADALGPNAIAGEMGTPNIHNAQGRHANGMPWVSAATCGGEHGPWGATRAGDADSYSICYQANALDAAIESIESDFPVAIMRREYVPDSAGAGCNRGGAAVLKDSLWLEPTQHNVMNLRFKRATGFGVFGGRDGKTGGVWLWEPTAAAPTPLIDTGGHSYRSATAVAGRVDSTTQQADPGGEYVYYARVPYWRTQPYATFRYVTNAGGGWGHPFDRDPERVKRDVRDGYVSIDSAARDYGVVIHGDPEWDPENLSIDHEATRRLRGAR